MERKDANPVRIHGTCEWFTRHAKFRHWNNGNGNGLLWVSADPGCGKSVLAKYLVDEVLPQPGRLVCYFFFKDGYPDQQSASKAFCAILHQLYLQQPRLVRDHTVKTLGLGLGFAYESIVQLWNLLLEAVNDPQAGEIACVIDALDECQRKDFMVLSELITTHYMKNEKPKLKLMLLSRPYQHIQWQFQELENDLPMIHLGGEEETETKDIIKEIDVVIQSRVATMGKRRKLFQDECEHVYNCLTAVYNRTYLWVTLTLDVIENLPGFTRGSVIRTVTHLPQTVNEAYSRIISRSTDLKTARKILHCVMAAKQPLSVGQLMTMIAIEEDIISNDFYESIETGIRAQATLRNICGLCLVVIEEKVFFLHQTVREYLLSPHQSENSTNLKEANLTLARICLWFINEGPHTFDPYHKQVSTEMKANYKECTDYSWYHWFQHFRISEYDVATTIKAADLIDPTVGVRRIGNHLLSSHIKYPSQSGRLLSAVYSKDRSVTNNMLTGAAIFGLHTIFHGLLWNNTDADVNTKDGRYGMTVLSWAICSGSTEIFEMCLAHERIDARAVDHEGFSPLYHAINTRETYMMVRLIDIVGLQAEPGGISPVRAIVDNSSESEETQKLLGMFLAHPTLDINASIDEFGSTALVYSATRDHVKYLRQILQHSHVQINAWWHDCGLVLIQAVLAGALESVSVLLQHPDIEINAFDVQGRTALIHTVQSSNEEWSINIFHMLLQHPDIDVNASDRTGRTALMYAAASASEEKACRMTDLLLQHPDIDVNAYDHHGQTALIRAATSKQSIAHIRKLLEHQEIRSHMRDIYGQTALSTAVQRGDYIVIGVMLQVEVSKPGFSFEEFGRVLPEIVAHSYVDLVKRTVLMGSAKFFDLTFLTETMMKVKMCTTKLMEESQASANHCASARNIAGDADLRPLVSLSNRVIEIKQALSEFRRTIQIVLDILSAYLPGNAYRELVKAIVGQHNPPVDLVSLRSAGYMVDFLEEKNKSITTVRDSLEKYDPPSAS